MHVTVGQPPLYPHRCAVMPQLVNLALDPSTRYVDTGIDYEVIFNQPERMYVSETAVSAMAKELGHPTKEEHTLALARAEAAEAEVAQLREEVREYDRRFEGIDALESADFRARRKAGRPAKQPTAKAA